MAGLNIYSSNRMESLFDMLTHVLSIPLPSPFDSEIIVVQNKGIERWLSMVIARHFGICANYLFPFPNKIVLDIFKSFLPLIDGEKLISQQYMTWKLMDILPQLSDKKEFISLNNYLKDGRMLKRYQLACRLSEVFDKYTIYRPDMLMSWQEQGNEHWQAQLWKRVIEGREEKHFAALRKTFFEKMSTLDTQQELPDIPLRFSVFGISALPSYHIEVLLAVSQVVDIHLFFLNPCKHYWADIIPFKDIEKRQRRKGKGRLTAQELYLEEGNSLLASMGAMGRDFFRTIQNLNYHDQSAFVDPGHETILTTVQSDIFHLRNPEPDHKIVIKDGDESIQIHSCHSPMREMEVLHDNLLHIFECEPSLEPKDVVVMTPDIEAYTPFIEAVFGTYEDESKQIPFSIADRRPRRTSSVIDTFIKILSLPESRFGASSILSLLESEPLLRAFGLSPGHRDIIQRWISTTEIRWGIDEYHRAQYGLPPMRENTWKAGLHRLMLGYAMSTSSEKLFHDIFPYEGPEGDEAQVLGNFMELMENLFTYSELLEKKHTVNEWAQLLGEILTVFFNADEERERDIQDIRQVIDDLTEVSQESEFNEHVDREIILSHLNSHLGEDRFGKGFIMGKVTFCTLVPMRSIPFKVVCLAGMNDGAFPRMSRNHSFDLMAENPYSGDPGKEKEDRYLFLEALISARKYLVISYVGQDIKDNSHFPPSVLVSEFIDYLDERFILSSGNSTKDKILKKHRLQAFSPEYFKTESSLFSYSDENYRSSHFIVNPSFQKPDTFISRTLPQPQADFYTVDIEQLCSFFSNPAKYLLMRRLGIYLHDMAEAASEREPFLLDSLENYILSQYLVEKRLKGLNREHLFKIIKAQGILPHANVGARTFEQAADEVDSFVKKVKRFNIDEHDNPLLIDFERSRFRITGTINHLYHGRLIHFRCASVKPKDRLRLWIYHIMMISAGFIKSLDKSILIGKDSVWEFLPVNEADSLVDIMLDKYLSGLSRPLHFFPNSSWAYAESLLIKNKSDDEAMKEAEKRWIGNEYNPGAPGECNDLYYKQCFGEINPLDDDFRENSIAIFEPLIINQEEVGC